MLFCLIDENEIHNNPNLHSEEQDELEIPDSTSSFVTQANLPALNNETS